MSQVPAQPGRPAADVLLRPDWRPLDDEELRAREVWGFISRNWWLIGLCTMGALVAAAVLTARATPIYQAAATLRIDDKQPNLPEIFRTLSTGSELVTEAEVLRSRTLAEDAAAALALQVRLLEPRRVLREQVFRDIHVDRDAPPTTIELLRRPDGRFRVTSTAAPPRAGPPVAAGESVKFPGGTLTLTPAAASYETIRFEVQPFDGAVAAVMGEVAVSPPSRDAKILTVRYRDPDRQLVWHVPNAIVERYLSRRDEMRKGDARSTVDFLRRQLDTASVQLAAAENELSNYREEELVVSPEAEATSQVTRLITMQSERGTLEGERAALAKLTEDVAAQAARRRPGEPSPYRQLLAFPTLLRTQAATELLQSLTKVEQDRATLLTRRTLRDPDVQAMTARVGELEAQLRSVVGAYLQGLTNQIATLDSGLTRFGRQLERMPAKELEVVRLERKSKILEGIYTLLQTRLKEAEIAEASQDPSVRLVDPAAPPRGPVSPKRSLNLLAGAFGGLLVGVAAAFVREARDRAVHTRADVQTATGLPVLGLIPRIRGPRQRVALIAEEAGDGRRGQARNGSPVRDTHRRRRPVSYALLTMRLQHGEADRDPWATGETDGGAGAVLHLALSKLGRSVAEAYGMLQTNIVFCRTDVRVKTMVVTSPLPGEGKTTSAANLALTLGQRGLAVLLIDADLRRGVLHNVFGVSRSPGLSEVLLGTVALAQARHGIELGEGRTVHCLTAGAPVPNPSSLVDSSELRALLARAREEYDAVIVDSPPANLRTDAALLGASADGVIMVARAGVTEAAALVCAMEQLRHVRAPVLGVVLNDIDFQRDASYDRAYRYYNSDRYADSSA